MLIRVEVRPRDSTADARARALIDQVAALGHRGVRELRVSDIYFLSGTLDAARVERLVAELLFDPVVQGARWRRLDEQPQDARVNDGWVVEVAHLPGVTDPVAESVLRGASLLGVHGVEQAARATRYEILGALDEAAVRSVCERLLHNPVIQTYALNQCITPPLVPHCQVSDTVEIVHVSGLDDDGLRSLSRARRLALNVEEMRAIRDHFRGENREPTDVEIETLAQTWSEHCVHKTFRGLIRYEELDQDGRAIPDGRIEIDSLLDTYIRSATERAGKPWIRSALEGNAGIMALDDRYDLAVKVETHNHPSALEPFGGAGTGIGGVIRDVIGVSARPIALTNVLCFGPLDLPWEDLPAGTLHPRRIADGVVEGIADCGNKMGIPNVNGAILHHRGFVTSPLVYCGCLGIVPAARRPTGPNAGDLIVVLGGRTGRDGLRGATFSSLELTHESGRTAGSAVQIGHPIHEKQVLEAVIRARDENLYTAITDCGAGGLSSAVGELAGDLGAEVHLDRVPLKYPGLRPWEIWLSEAQERMVLAVPPSRWPALEGLCRALDVEAGVLGTFTDSGRLVLRHHGREVGNLSLRFLHDGLPRRTMPAVWRRPALAEPEFDDPADLTGDLLALLATPNVRSKEHVVRPYDQHVQGGTVLPPFVGTRHHGPSDAAVVVPLELLAGHADPAAPLPGVALAAGINPAYGEIDPYCMAWAAVDEALRNCVAVGADPDRVAILDNFCWGNPDVPERLGALVRCVQGCHDAAVAYGVPFISGKDSLNNEYTAPDGTRHAVPGTLLISAVGTVPDAHRTVTMDLKQPGDLLYVVGETRDELGGSAWYGLHDRVGARAPQPQSNGAPLLRALHRAMAGGLVSACHDCCEGGIAVAAAEMAIAGERGLELSLERVPQSAGISRNAVLAFSESLARFLVTVPPDRAEAFEDCFAGLPLAAVGEVRRDGRFIVSGRDGRIIIDTDIRILEHAWRGHTLNGGDVSSESEFNG